MRISPMQLFVSQKKINLTEELLKKKKIVPKNSKNLLHYKLNSIIVDIFVNRN